MLRSRGKSSAWCACHTPKMRSSTMICLGDMGGPETRRRTTRRENAKNRLVRSASPTSMPRASARCWGRSVSTRPRRHGEARRAHRYPHAAPPEADLRRFVPKLRRHAAHEVVRRAIRPLRSDGGSAERAVDGHQRAERSRTWVLMGWEMSGQLKCGANALKHLGQQKCAMHGAMSAPGGVAEGGGSM
jgi:hypothetical protein